MTYINKEELLAAIEDARAKSKNTPIIPIVRAFPGVDQLDGCHWNLCSRKLPDDETTTFVTALLPGAGLQVLIASYSPEGYHNGGHNLWSCEQVIGPMAGCKVLAWMQAPTAYEG